MRRNLFTEDHEAFRELARGFIEKEVVPAYPEWEKGGRMPPRPGRAVDAVRELVVHIWRCPPKIRRLPMSWTGC